MKNIRTVVEFNLTRPDLSVQNIADLTRSSRRTVMRFRRVLKLSGSAENWLALSDAQLRERLSPPRKTTKIRPDFAAVAQRLHLSRRAQWEAYAAQHGRRALSVSQFNKVIRKALDSGTLWAASDTHTGFMREPVAASRGPQTSRANYRTVKLGDRLAAAERAPTGARNATASAVHPTFGGCA